MLSSGALPDPVPAVEGEPGKVEKALQVALNRTSAENGSNTPDFVLARFLDAALAAFDQAVRARESWYGVWMRPGAGREPLYVVTVEDRRLGSRSLVFSTEAAACEVAREWARARVAGVPGQQVEETGREGALLCLVYLGTDSVWVQKQLVDTPPVMPA